MPLTNTTIHETWTADTDGEARDQAARRVGEMQRQGFAAKWTIGHIDEGTLVHLIFTKEITEAPAEPQTLAQRYNAEAERLLPHMADRLTVDPAIDDENEIDEIVFRRGEFSGGMAAAILATLRKPA